MSENAEQCPKCSRNTSELIPIDAGMKLALQSHGDSVDYTDVCPLCYNELAGSVSQGAKLRIEQKNKERNRQVLWKSRVNLVKKARNLMYDKAFSEAAIHYEKYLRVLEMSYELKPGALSPDVFGSTKRSKEITIIASTYWDLMRIYDTTNNYRDRMKKSSNKLALFLPYSPIFPDVVKRAQSFVKTCKNPDIVKDFLRQVKANNQSCFIATCVYDYPYCPEINILRKFRDEKLMVHSQGRLFVRIYYKLGPLAVHFIEQLPILKAPLRFALNYFIRFHLKKS